MTRSRYAATRPRHGNERPVLRVSAARAGSGGTVPSFLVAPLAPGRIAGGQSRLLRNFRPKQCIGLSAVRWLPAARVRRPAPDNESLHWLAGRCRHRAGVLLAEEIHLHSGPAADRLPLRIDRSVVCILSRTASGDRYAAG